MKKVVVGYIMDNVSLVGEDKKFFRIAKEMNIELVPFSISGNLIEDEIEEKARKCDVIFNDSGDILSIELVRSLEILGKKVLEPSKAYDFPENKWVFYVLCKKNKIPVPETILLSNDLNTVKIQLKEFGHWPVVLKRVDGSRGEFVEKASNVTQSLRIIKKFWKKGNERLPVLAQEFINSDSYRVTVIGKNFYQTALKKKHGWKATGVYAKRLWHFKMDKELKKIVDKVVKVTKIKICGIDFFKKNGKWLVLEVNAEPSFEMFDCQHEKMIRETLKFLRKEASY